MELQRSLKKVASQRVQDLESWHRDSLDLFSRHLSDHERGIIAKCFQGGLVLMSGSIPEAGGVLSLPNEDAMFVAEVLQILQKSPKPPHARFVSRYVYIPNATAIMSAAAHVPEAGFPPRVGSLLPHMLPFASTLREGFAMYWTHRTDVLKTETESPCCVLRIRVPRGTPAFFWGPTAVPKPEAIERMRRGLFDKKMNEFEVLLPPANLRITRIHIRNLEASLRHLPEYSQHVPDLSQVSAMFPKVPIYECEMEPLALGFLVCNSMSTALQILGVASERVRGTTLLIAREHLEPQVRDRMDAAIAARKAKWVPLTNPVASATPSPSAPVRSRFDPTQLAFDDKVDYSKVKRHLERVIRVMEVFNKYNPNTITPYPVEEAVRALANKDTLVLRRIIGTFWSDLVTSYDGFQQYFFDTVMDELLTTVYERLQDWIGDLETYTEEFELEMMTLLKMCDNNLMFQGTFAPIEESANKSSAQTWYEYIRESPDHLTLLQDTLRTFWKKLKAFDKDLRSAKRYLILQQLQDFRYNFRVRLNQRPQCAEDEERIELAKAKFVEAMVPMLEPYTQKHNVLGVSFVPLHNGTIVLGKEKGGVYKNKYNYFGGKILDKASHATAHTVAEVLFEECFEESGIILEAPLFQTALRNILVAPFRDQGVSLLLVCNISDLTPKWWNSIFVHRTEDNCEWKYREMSMVQQFKLSALQKGAYPSSLFSQYVLDTLHLLEGPLTPNSQRKTKRTPKTKKSGVSVRQFPTLSIKNTTLQYLSP